MTQDTARGRDTASVRAGVDAGLEIGIWHCRYRVDKYHDGREPDGRPDEVLEGEGNMLMNAGIQVMLDLLARNGAGPVYSNSALAYLAVGDNSVGPSAEDPTDTTLDNELARVQATAVVTNQSVAFSASFGGAVGTGDWEEVGTFNAAAAGDMLNRIVSSLGTKPGGATWVLTVTITIS